ncbi:MAG TPA: nucleoside triphosphate pyrophosphatase [Planctomycetota bacterium]|nr:nucleoside triphosphate pyrophosphatase [Planctomycetota bacterium]
MTGETDPGARTARCLVLASASPRRRELLPRLGVPFEVATPAGIDEDTAVGTAREIAGSLAVSKAELVLARLSRERDVDPLAWVVLGADTVVAVMSGGREIVLGKPRDRDDARRMLEHLSARQHTVWTGVAAARRGEPTRLGVEATEVTFRPLSAEDIERHLESGDHAGKAGAYGIQGAGRALVEGFAGCYYNIVGLPLGLTARLLGGLVPRGTLPCDCRSHPLQRGRAGCGESFDAG